jgi:sacsin
MTSTDFGQEVRLTTRLHDLVRSYPRGNSIISEFIQNADDAESSSLTVTLDVCSYTGERLEDQRMVSLLGPALLVHNESVFSDPDFESIKRIGESSKAESGPKTGRFGVGFNTCYNITDFPSFVSGHFLVCFDPHYTTVAERGKAPGKRWRLSDAWASSPDWLRSFCSAGMKENESYFPGTIFRFPLRTPQQATVSEIWKESFCLDDYSRIVQQLSEDGPQLLLFTKYLTELTALIADGSTKRLLHISTSNRIEVVRARDPLLRSVQLDLKQAISKWKTSRGSLPVCSYEHGFRVATASSERIIRWAQRLPSRRRGEDDKHRGESAAASRSGGAHRTETTEQCRA